MCHRVAPAFRWVTRPEFQHRWVWTWGAVPIHNLRSRVLIALNKPYLVQCKFTDDNRPTLAQLGLPPRVYAAGRLDHDSEGLVLLTDDGRLNQRLTDPRWKVAKTYLAQVEG